MWDDLDPDDENEHEPQRPEQPASQSVSPGERLLHALGQLHRLHLCGRLPAHPSEFDIGPRTGAVERVQAFAY